MAARWIAANTRLRFLMLAAAVPMLLCCACGGSSSGSPAPSPNSLLQGTCIWQSLSLPTTGSNAGPVTILSPLTFDGAGHITFDYYVNLNGTFSTTPNVTGTYQIASDGHGSMSYLSPASSNTITLDIYLTPGGHAVRTILRSYVNQTTSPRVSSGICRFDE